MKKICFITTISLTLRMFVLKTAEYIHNNTDWDITFICDKDDEFEKSLPDYIHYIPIKMKRGISLSGINAMFSMIKIFRKEKFDMIQYSTPNASFYAALAGKIAGIKVRLYCQWGLAYVGFSGVKRTVFKLLEKQVCSLSTWIEPDSNSNLSFSHNEKLYPLNKGSVIGFGSACGVDMNKFNVARKEVYRKEIRDKYNLSSEDYVFGFVGRITKDKGINELFSAFKSIANTQENLYLMMVGPSEADETIDESLSKWAYDSSCVIYTGFTNEVEKYLSAMDAYILPSYREGFGMGVVEAEAMGVPVIITNIPGPVDAMINNETGIIVKKQDVDSLKDAMEKFLGNPQMMNEYGNNGIKLVTSRFEQKSLFEELLADRKRLLGE